MKANWIANLSDGQTTNEREIKTNSTDEKSSWLQLIDYLKKNPSKKITSIQLVINGFVYNTPKIKTNKNCHYDEGPDRFSFHKKDSFVFLGAYEKNSFYGFSYRVDNNRHYFWINTRNNETYMEVYKIDKRTQESNIEKFYDEVADECSI